MNLLEQNTQRISKLRSKRLEEKLTQKQLATRFNNYIDKENLKVKHTSYTTISRWESGIVEPKETTLKILANILNTYPSQIRGYELTKKEKEKEVEDLLGKLYVPYQHNDAELKDFYEMYFYDDFEGLLDTIVSSNNYIDLDKFDITKSLETFLEVFYPKEGKALSAKINTLTNKINDSDQLQKAILKITPTYFRPFINDLTKDIDKEFHIDHGHWYNSDTFLFLKRWFDKQIEIEKNRRHPEYKKLNDFYMNRIFRPLMNLQIDFGPEHHNFSEKELTPLELQKRVNSIKSSLDKYASMLKETL